MLENRVSWRPRYAVSDDDCHGGTWVRRRFVEAMTGETDGELFELRRGGRKHFEMVSGGTVLTTADAARRGRWTISMLPVGGRITALVFETERPAAGAAVAVGA